MIITDLAQGTPEWEQAHLFNHTASQAPVMMGVGKYQKRPELLQMKVTGVPPEFPPAVQFLFDKGHAAEKKARPIAEEIIGEELFAIVATDDSGRYMASFDGITMGHDVIWEHKLFNQELANQIIDFNIDPGLELDPHYTTQLDHALMVSGASKALFMTSDGTRNKLAWCWYTTTPEKIERLKAGWKQFDADMDAYKHRQITQAKGSAPEALPILDIRVIGQVQASNLIQFQGAYQELIKRIPTDLKTDEDFANAEETVKFLDKAEKSLEEAKSRAIQQASSIDELFRAIDKIKEEMRGKRLQLTKVVSTRKDAIRDEIFQEHLDGINDHIAKLNQGLGQAPLPKNLGKELRDAMKNKRTIKSLHDACDAVAAAAKTDASILAATIRTNLDAFAIAAKDYSNAFPDLPTLAQLDPPLFGVTIQARVTELNRAKEEAEKRAEQARIEAEARAEALAKAKEEAEKRAEQARIEAEARAAAQAEALAQAAVEAKAAAEARAVAEAQTAALAKALADAQKPTEDRVHVQKTEGKIILFTPHAQIILTQADATRLISELENAL